MKAYFEKLKTLFSSNEFKRTLIRDFQFTVGAVIAMGMIVFLISLTGNNSADVGQKPPEIMVSVAQPFQGLVKKVGGTRKYVVRLSWKRTPGVRKWFIYRKYREDFFENQQLAQLHSRITKFQDTSIEAGKSYVYFLSADSDTGYRGVGRFEVTIPEAAKPVLKPIHCGVCEHLESFVKGGAK